MNEEKLICVSLNIHTTSVCTLRCAKCGWSFPKFQTPLLADINKTIAALDPVFQVYDYIEEVRFGGAEAFLYPDIEKMMCALIPFQSKFKYAIVVTNGTYIPKQSIIETMKQLPYPIMVRVDNYGILSKRYDEVVDTLRINHIKIDERVYAGDNQAFGGWVDYGDYSYKNYSKEELKRVFFTCRNPDDCALLLDDKLTNCGFATVGYLLGKVSMPLREIVDLSSGESVDEMRKKIRAWRDEPFEACKYCNGFDPVNSPRIPAAEQLPGKQSDIR